VYSTCIYRKRQQGKFPDAGCEPVTKRAGNVYTMYSRCFRIHRVLHDRYIRAYQIYRMTINLLAQQVHSSDTCHFGHFNRSCYLLTYLAIDDIDYLLFSHSARTARDHKKNQIGTHYTQVHAVSSIKRATFVFMVCGLILITSSLLHSQLNCQRAWNKSYVTSPRMCFHTCTLKKL